MIRLDQRIELSEFGKLSHTVLTVTGPTPFTEFRILTLRALGLVGLNRCCDLFFYRIQQFVQASDHSFARSANIAIDRLLDAFFFLIQEIQKLPPPLNKSVRFDFVFGLSNLRRWSQDFAKSRDDLRIDRVLFVSWTPDTTYSSSYHRLHRPRLFEERR